MNLPLCAGFSKDGIVRRLIVALAVFVAALSSASLAHAQKRVALVVCNGAYGSFSSLPNPTNDAADMAVVLRGLGFSLVGDGPQVNVGRLPFLALLRDFAAAVQPGDVALFYYAGHGVQVENVNYMVPVDDRDIRYQDDVPDLAVSLEALRRQFKDKGAAPLIVILDACRNTALPSRSRAAERGLARLELGSGAYIAFATAPGATAYDGDGRNGRFTAALLQALRNPARRIEDIFIDVTNRVEQESGGRQSPWTSSNLRAPFHFAGQPAAAPSVAVPPPAPPVQPAPLDREPIAIGVAGPMTGQFAVFGDQMRLGVELAVADLNRKGGVAGRRLKIEVGDDVCDPRQAVSVANRFALAGVKFVVGHFCSGSSIPASQVYDEEGILQISPASTNPKLTEQGLKNVFRVCGRDDQQGIVSARYIASHHRGASVAVIHDRSAYGKSLADTAHGALRNLNVTVALNDSITAGERDYSAIVERIRQSGARVVYFGGFHTEAGLIVRRMRESKVDAVLVSADALVTNEYWSLTGSAGEGTLMTFAPDPREHPQAQAVVRASRQQGYEPEGYVLYAYAAVQAFAQAAQAAGSIDMAPMAAALRRVTVDSVIGRLSFDGKGDRMDIDYVLYRWSNGRYEPCRSCKS